MVRDIKVSVSAGARSVRLHVDTGSSVGLHLFVRDLSVDCARFTVRAFCLCAVTIAPPSHLGLRNFQM